MKRNWIIIPTLALCIAGGLRPATAADTPADGKPAKRERKVREPRVREPKLPPRLRAQFEEVLGKPLTDDQVKQLAQEEADFKAATEALRQQHRAKQAQLIGVTTEQLEASELTARKKLMEEKKAQREAAPAK